MKKTGMSVQSAALPHGYSLRFNVGREQPFTLWLGDEVVFFCNTVVEAVSFAKNGK